MTTDRIRNLRLTDEEMHSAWSEAIMIVAHDKTGLKAASPIADAQYRKLLEGLVETLDGVKPTEVPDGAFWVGYVAAFGYMARLLKQTLEDEG